jgi:hypothetical protein
MKQLALLLGVMIMTSTAQQHPPRQTVTVKGIVLQIGSRQPVAKVLVKLADANDQEAVGVTTGPDGRFEFENVPDGRYSLVASRNGYLESNYGQRGPSGSSRDLVIQSGIFTNNIELILTPSGAVSGRVVDNTGDPVMNVTVAALKYAYRDGQKVLISEETAQSNDLGEFRIFGLPPGQYLINAKPQKAGSRLNQFVSDGAAVN